MSTFEVNGLTVKLVQDEDPVNPRKDYDQLGVLVDWHRRQDIGERKVTARELAALKRGGFGLLRRYLRRTLGAVCVIPVGLLDHSGQHIYVGGGAHPSDPGGWDSGTVGFIYATRESVEKLGAPLELVEEALTGEVEEYDQYIRGDVYGYTIENAAGETVDSCWGLFGWEYAEAEAKRAAEAA